MRTTRLFISWDTGHYKLNLPVFFEKSTLKDIRLVLKLLDKYSYQNESAMETLNEFFPAWEGRAKGRLELCMEARQAAEKEVQEAQSRVACFGSVVTKSLTNDLKKREKNLQNASNETKRAKAAMERCNKIISAYAAITANKIDELRERLSCTKTTL